jgi:hypothetical protein
VPAVAFSCCRHARQACCSTDSGCVAIDAVQENKRLGRQQAAAAAAGSSSSTGQPDWLAAVGFDEEYLAQERLLGLQKGHVPPGYTYDDGMYYCCYFTVCIVFHSNGNHVLC